MTHRVNRTFRASLQGVGMEAPLDPRAPSSGPCSLLHTMAVNLKVSHRLVQQIQKDLGRLELSATGARGPDVSPWVAKGRRSSCPVSVGPPCGPYSLLRSLPEDCEWAQNLETQLRTGVFHLMTEEQLDQALCFLCEEPIEETTEENSEGPTLYCSALDRIEAQLCGGAEGEDSGRSPEHSDGGDSRRSPEHSHGGDRRRSPEHSDGGNSRRSPEHSDGGDSRRSPEHSDGGNSRSPEHSDGGDRRRSTEHSDGGAEGGDNSEEDPTPSVDLLQMERGELSSIMQSPHHLRLHHPHLRPQAPCYSTPRSTGEPSVLRSPFSSQSFFTAVDRSAEHRDEAPTPPPLLFASEGRTETQEEAQEEAEEEAQEEAELEDQEEAELEDQEEAEEEAQGEAEGERGTEEEAEGEESEGEEVEGGAEAEDASGEDSPAPCEEDTDTIKPGPGGAETRGLGDSSTSSPSLGHRSHGRSLSLLLSDSHRAHSTLDHILQDLQD
ncbi:unnamed protein product [Knipowitschia caucasica]|uniref:Uncharacterized protein n=1 Tax=Knipowitschia caucasica TaxID=637954 RepID=A0AAV2J5W9_KNICA